MKRNSNSQDFDPVKYESYDSSDTRYYGVFLKGHDEDQSVSIDPKRYRKFFEVSEEMKKVLDKRMGPLFQPAKKKILDYNVNFMRYILTDIRQQWEKTNKPMIERVLSEICGKVFTPMHDDLAMSGILDPYEAATNASMKTLLSHHKAEAERYNVYFSLYAQYFHQMASRVEALFLNVLTHNGFEGDKFNRNILYAFKGANQENVRNLDGFAEFDKLYAIWNFIKHNSLSTFNALKELSPDAIKEGEYTQGELACFFVNFDDTLIYTILTGVDRFIKEYCRLVFKEDEYEASWNSEEYFLHVVHEAMETEFNPLGLPPWI